MSVKRPEHGTIGSTEYGWFTRDDLLKEIQQLRGELNKYHGALIELCYVKAIKDKDGKTKEYLSRQPHAWVAAFRLLEQLAEKDGE